MIALGICRVEEEDGLPHLPCPTEAGCGLAVLLSEGDARTRLVECLALQERGVTFLPFAPARAPSAAQACGWLAAHGPEMVARLAEVAGRAELLVTLDRPPMPAETMGRDAARSGRSWLRACQTRHARHRALEQSLRDMVADHVACQGQQGAVLSILPGQRLGTPVEGALLLPVADIPAVARALHAACPADVTCRTTGPWPVFVHAATLLLSEAA